jgi:glycosyltransferase involved in cell wall biosynthesis
MGKNKLNSLFSVVIIYPLGFLFLTPYLLIKLILNRNVQNYLVLFPGILELCFLKLFKPFFNYKITYDTFTTFHLTLVEDRKIVKDSSFLANVLKLIDKLFFYLPDNLIFETQEMLDYLNMFLNKKKDNSLVLKSYRHKSNKLNLIPTENKNRDIVNVVFWGSFEKMHGLDTILDSAKQLGEQYVFNLIGKGTLFQHIKDRVISEEISNVKLLGYKSKDLTVEDNLYKYIINSNICLGAFSTSLKYNLVIPGKVIEALMFQKPVITAESKYIKNNCDKAVLAIPPECSKSLTEGIKFLVEDKKYKYNLKIQSNLYIENNHTLKIFEDRLLNFLI